MQQNDCAIDYMPPLNSTVFPGDKVRKLIGECNITGYCEDYKTIYSYFMISEKLQESRDDL